MGIPLLESFTEDWQPSSRPTRQKRTEIIVNGGCFILIPQSAFTHRTERLYGRPCQEKCLTWTWVPSWIEVEEGHPLTVNHAILYEESVGSSLLLLRGLTLSRLRMWIKAHWRSNEWLKKPHGQWEPVSFPNGGRPFWIANSTHLQPWLVGRSGKPDWAFREPGVRSRLGQQQDHLLLHLSPKLSFPVSRSKTTQGRTHPSATFSKEKKG